MSSGYSKYNQSGWNHKKSSILLMKNRHVLIGKQNHRFIHGMRYTNFYKIWQHIKDRCLNDKNKSFYYYGGRGIKVCKRWMKFKNFYDDMFPNYCEHVYQFGLRNTSIDRINNNGNYELNNCRWATHKIQGNNMSKNKLIVFNKKIKTMSQWAEELNINYNRLRYRINNNWPIKMAFSKNTYSARSLITKKYGKSL